MRNPRGIHAERKTLYYFI